MASKAATSRHLQELRAAYGQTPEVFAAALSAHLKGVVLTAAQILRWEAGKGPSSRYRALLGPVLELFQRHLDAELLGAEGRKP